MDPSDEPETALLWLKWKFHFQIFLRNVDYRYGNLLRLPTNEDAIDQPSKTISVMDQIHTVYLEKKTEENENHPQF